MKKQSSKPKEKRAPKPTPEKASLPQDGPLQVAVVSHCKLDVKLVDAQFREPLDSPFFTVAMDVFSRAVTGFALTMGAPAIGTCIARSILPKEAWLKERKITAKWPISGVPATIMVDNALEFRSPDLAKACAAYSINIAWRPLGTPDYAAIGERFVSSLSKELKKLPKSALTLKEMEKCIALYVASYNNTVNSHIQATPLAKFKEGILTSGIAPALEEKRVHLDFLPTHSVTVQKYGIRFKGQVYSSPVLAPHVKSTGKHHIRYNPVDLDSVYFYDSGTKSYNEIPKR